MVCVGWKDCVFSKEKESPSALKIHEEPISLEVLHGSWPVGMGLLNTQADAPIQDSLSLPSHPRQAFPLTLRRSYPWAPVLGRVREARIGKPCALS